VLLPLAIGPLALAGCTNATSSVQGQSASPLLATSPSTRTVELQVLAADSTGSSQFNFDGASDGAMTITVPLGWKIEVTCANRSTVLSHSCAIVQPASARLAFKGSSTSAPTMGVPPGKAEAFSFVANKAGSYQLVCLVPGHRDAGMWDHFVVSSGGRASIVGARL
jgi:sulfocyanin